MVKASFSVRLAMVTRGFETRLQILPSKEVRMVRHDGFNHVRDSICRRHLPIFIWSWDRTWSNPDFEQVHMARCVGFNHVRNSIWQA